MYLKKQPFVFLFLIFFAVCSQANIQFFPTRINLSPKNKTATVSLRLRSDKAETFRISTMFYEMYEDGSVKQRPELSRSPESAASYIRFSPKQVTLQPNVEQIVRLRVRNISRLNQEVRTHLYFRPMEDPLSKYVQKAPKGKNSFNLKAQIAVAIPVVVTPKPLKKDFFLENFRFVKNKKTPSKFSFDLIKNSPGFLYGDVHVYKIDGKKKKLVAQAKGVSSYIKKRKVSYPFSDLKGAPRGLYQLEFTEYSQAGEPEQGLVKALKYIY